jgi:hypothetical protein
MGLARCSGRPFADRGCRPRPGGRPITAGSEREPVRQSRHDDLIVAIPRLGLVSAASTALLPELSYLVVRMPEDPRMDCDRVRQLAVVIGNGAKYVSLRGVRPVDESVESSQTNRFVNHSWPNNSSRCSTVGGEFAPIDRVPFSKGLAMAAGLLELKCARR